MEKIFSDPLFGLLLTLGFYLFFKKVHIVLKKHYLQPVITSGAAIILFLEITGIPLSSYMAGGRIVLQLLPVATLFLAIPLYLRISVAKKYMAVVFVSITAGCAAGVLSVIYLGKALGLDPEIYFSLVSKSVTMPLALGITDKIGGIAELTAAGVVLTGISGLFVADAVFLLLRIKNPLSTGLALGTAAHILGTGKAIETGMTEGSVSSLSMVSAGIITSLIVPVILIFA